MIVSKSLVKSCGCETYAAAYALRPTAVARTTSPLADTGTIFHRYRQQYIEHLVETQMPVDKRWAEDWLATQNCGDDAERLVRRDMESFAIDPEAVIATELYLSIDKDGEPLDRFANWSSPGVYPKREGVADAGTIDLLSRIDATTLQVTDYKSGWSTSGVTDEEPSRYAALLFAHFPNVNTVIFIWDFARVRLSKHVTFSREHLPMIRKQMERTRRRIEDIKRRADAGETLGVDPTAGLCGFCQLQCPLKPEPQKAVTRPGDRIDIAPIQTEDDARKAATLVYLCDILGARSRQQLKAWIDQHGPVDLTNDWDARLVTRQKAEYPLPHVMRILGSDLPEFQDCDKNGSTLSLRYGIPIDKLTVGAAKINQYAKTAKRIGLSKELRKIAKVTPVSVLKIGSRVEAIQGMEEGIEEGD